MSNAMQIWAEKHNKKLPTRNVKSNNVQYNQHMKEDHFLSFLAKEYKQYWNEYRDEHIDYSTGVDVYLDNIPYDLKVSNSGKLTLFKNYNGKWYSPLLEHQEVRYLYVVEHDTYYNLYEFDKSQLLYQMYNQLPKLSTYGGDGNKNITFEVDFSKALTERILTK